MTTFILHGGNTSDNNPLNKEFFKAIVDATPSHGRVLLVYFSREQKDYGRLFAQDTATMKSLGGTSLSFDLADEKTFDEQVRQANSIYLRGGDPHRLLGILKNHPSFKNDVRGKTIAGSSAGAYALAQYYYSNSEDDFFDGLGLVPLKVMCHYADEKQSIANEFNQYGESLKLIRLRNCEYTIITT